MSHIFFPIAGCSKSCEAAQYWSSGFTVLQASIDAAIIQVNMVKEEKKLYFNNCALNLYNRIWFTAVKCTEFVTYYNCFKKRTKKS